MQNQTQTTASIREHMPIVCSEGGQFATVDHLDGNYIKVTKDNASGDGQHHWVPLNWVTGVDDKVHVDRPGNQAMKDWISSDPNTRA
jgi:hypothetical protein